MRLGLRIAADKGFQMELFGAPFDFSRLIQIDGQTEVIFTLRNLLQN